MSNATRRLLIFAVALMASAGAAVVTSLSGWGALPTISVATLGGGTLGLAMAALAPWRD